MAKTHIDKRSKEARPPAWEPPKLLLVDEDLHVEADSCSGVWLLGSIVIWRIINWYGEKE